MFPLTIRAAIFPIGGKEDVNSAVLAAKQAFKDWGYSSKQERISLLETSSQIPYLVSVEKLLRTR